MQQHPGSLDRHNNGTRNPPASFATRKNQNCHYAKGQAPPTGTARHGPALAALDLAVGGDERNADQVADRVRRDFANSWPLISENPGVVSSVAVDDVKRAFFASVVNFIERALGSIIGARQAVTLARGAAACSLEGKYFLHEVDDRLLYRAVVS